MQTHRKDNQQTKAILFLYDFGPPCWLRFRSTWASKRAPGAQKALKEKHKKAILKQTQPFIKTES